MNRTSGIIAVTVAVVAVTGGIVALGNLDSKEKLDKAPLIVAQAAAPDSTQESVPGNATASEGSDALVRGAEKAPEMTSVIGQLVDPTGTPVSGGVAYFIFQNRLNEIPHNNPLDKVKLMTEVSAAVDAEGSFTLNMKPGNFAMVYDPAATEEIEAGPESMTAMKQLTQDQVQARIAAIKENASKGLPIENGKIGDAYVIENRFIRPPITDLAQVTLQSTSTITVKAVDDNGEIINFPATLRLRGKNGDIMEPHTPSVSKRAEYSFHDLLPQSYQVFALGTRPRPGAGDKISTPTVSNDQIIFTGEPLTHEAVVQQVAEEAE